MIGDAPTLRDDPAFRDAFRDLDRTLAGLTLPATLAAPPAPTPARPASRRLGGRRVLLGSVLGGLLLAVSWWQPVDESVTARPSSPAAISSPPPVASPPPSPAPQIAAPVVERPPEVRPPSARPSRPARRDRTAATPPPPAAPAPTEEPVPPAAPPLGPGELGDEVALIRAARAALDRGDAPGALAAIADYRGRFSRGRMTSEADFVELGALTALEDWPAVEPFAAALARRPEGAPRATELTLLRGTALAALGRCTDALTVVEDLRRKATAPIRARCR